MEENFMILGDRLREIRIQQGLKLSQVAKSTGLSISFLSDLELGRGAPSLDTLSKLAACYDISMSDIMQNVDGWQKTNARLAPGISDLIETGEISESVAQDLNRIELNGRRPKTAQEWRMVLQLLSFIIYREEGEVIRSKTRG
jgi:transcriptional regulator with XRE-family HTH domain